VGFLRRKSANSSAEIDSGNSDGNRSSEIPAEIEFSEIRPEINSRNSAVNRNSGNSVGNEITQIRRKTKLLKLIGINSRRFDRNRDLEKFAWKSISGNYRKSAIPAPGVEGGSELRDVGRLLLSSDESKTGRMRALFGAISAE
jgi:hypothetical protein